MLKKFLLLLYIVPLPLFAQLTEKYNNPYTGFYRAEELFEKTQYAAAREEFMLFHKTLADKNDPLYVKARYYEGLSALELYSNDAISLLEKFNKEFPESIYRFQISFRIGRYFFQKEDFENAQPWFQKVPVKELEEQQREEFLFKLGYSALQNEDKETAFNAFRDAKDGTSQYATPSLYFFAHLSYLNNSLQVALEAFQKLKDDATFGSIAPYYIVQILHRQNRFQEVIDFAPFVLDSKKEIDDLADVNHLIGNSYYRLGKYSEAISPLEKFISKGKPKRDDAYELGYSYFRTEQYEKAIKMFDRVTRQDDSLGQIAMYHIGESYLKLDKLLPARSAFERASEMKKIPEIQEDALYNFAVISFKVDINPYDESVRAFENYLSRYPNSKRKSDVYQYLVNAYASTSNFAKALESLDKLPSKDVRLKKVYQNVSFNYGVELYQKAQWDEAMSAFKSVDRYPIDPQMVALSRYWMADIHFRQNQLDKAITIYREFINSPASNALAEKIDAYYNIAYAHWQKEEFPPAIEAFRTYIQSSPNNREKLIDATFRVADGFYTTRQNTLAIQFYRDAYKLNSNFNDKALYYLGRAQGFNGQADEKILTLKELLEKYKTSKYRMNAQFELGKAHMSKQNFDEALKVFQQFVIEYPRSSLAIEAKLDVADLYYKKWDYSRAEKEYLSILNENEKNRAICEVCVRGLFDVYNAMNQPGKGADLAERYPCANISNDEKENIFFTPALNSYNDSNFVEAITKFETYLGRFPTGRYVNETFFYLGNSYFRTRDTANAVINYEKFLETPVNVNTEFAAIRVANFYYNRKQYGSALKYYERYELLTTRPNNLFNARLGAMRCAFLVESYQKAVDYAKIVLESPNVTNSLRIEAEYARGMSNFKLGNYDLAKPSLDWLVKNTTTAMGAEAKFTIAELFFKQAQYPLADAEIKALVKMKPSYNYWVAKGLMLQTRIQIINDELFQAEQTLKSVINFYPDPNDGVMDEANDLWDELMQLKNPPMNEGPKGQKIIEINGN